MKGNMYDVEVVRTFTQRATVRVFVPENAQEGQGAPGVTRYAELAADYGNAWSELTESVRYASLAQREPAEIK